MDTAFARKELFRSLTVVQRAMGLKKIYIHGNRLLMGILKYIAETNLSVTGPTTAEVMCCDLTIQIPPNAVSRVFTAWKG